MKSVPTTRVEALLQDLCTIYGYCLPPDQHAVLVDQPPQEVDAFVDAVLLADGLKPDLCDGRTRRELSDLVRDWLVDPDGKGARSGLP